MTTPPRNKSRFWRKCRILFRRFRITVLVLILAVLGSLLYINQIGLPGFIKRPLQEKLRARGLDLEFTRLRWRWTQGIVADNVQFGRAGEEESPRFTARRAQLQIDQKALYRLQFQISGVVLQEGRFSWSLTESNGPTREIFIEDIQTELHLLPGDLWELARFEAQFGGARIQLTGVVTNASAVPEWSFLKSRRPSEAGALEKRLRRLADLLKEIEFSSPPKLRVDVRGDARNLRSFAVRMRVSTPGASTPWGTVERGQFSVLLQPDTDHELSRAEINLQADSALTQWGTTTNLLLTAHLFSTESDTNIVHASLDLKADMIKTPWSQASTSHITAEWIHALNRPIPLSGRCQLEVAEPKTEWGSADQLHLNFNLLSATNSTAPIDEAWDWWNLLKPFAFEWDCQISHLQSPKLAVREFACSGEWLAPTLKLKKITGALYEGKLNAEAGLDVASRQFNFSSSSDFDILRVSPLLTPKSQEWLSHFSWIEPPTLNAHGSLILPSWTNRQPDWHGEVRPTIQLGGDFRVGRGAYRGVTFSFASSDFNYSNRVWRLPNVIGVRPEGRIKLALESNEATRDYHLRVQSMIDPGAIRPLLTPQQQRGFDIVRFTRPPVIDGELWGRWYDHTRIGGKGTLSVTNFEVRGEPIGSLQATLDYTNGFLLCLNPKAELGDQHATATAMGLDFAARKIYLTNGVGRVDPGSICRMISTNVARIMSPYHFIEPAFGRAHGTIPMQHPRDADLHFEAETGVFEWWKFKVPRLTGKADWVGEQLSLQSIDAQFYRGRIVGNADFDFRDKDSTDFRFDVVATGADLHSLMVDLTGKTNHLEGMLSARVTITQGNSKDWQNNLWGSGRLRLRDGLIWEIPVFGVLSPALDHISPGLGSSRASEGSARFVITNGVVRSEDLEIRSSVMRLQYSGSVDLRNQINARVQAELLRDTPLIGPVLSLALWPVSKLFEYKISGNLHEPKSEPIFFVPKVVLMPFHPFRSTKELTPEEPGMVNTNSSSLFP